MAACQAWDLALQELGLPAAVLMEQAARHLSDFLLSASMKAEDPAVFVLCGPGNNGADGVAAARQLLGSTLRPTVFLPLGAPQEGTLLQRQLAVFHGLGGRVRMGLEALDATDASPPTCWVDALFGIGLTRPIEGALGEALQAIQAQARPILAVDCPSGLNCDTGAALGHTLAATWTLSFAAPKQGFTLLEGPRHAGEVRVADLGVQASLAQAWFAAGMRFPAPKA